MTTKYLGNGNWAKRTNIDSSDIMLPVERQGVHAETIQTHNAVSVGASSLSSSDYYSADGFDKLAVSLKNDSSASSLINIIWSFDGVNRHGSTRNLSDSPDTDKSVIVDVLAPYFKVELKNGDASAHTMSAWAYLKA